MDARGGSPGCHALPDGSSDDFLAEAEHERERHEPWCLFNTGGMCSCSAESSYRSQYSHYKSSSGAKRSVKTQDLYQDSPYTHSEATHGAYSSEACHGYPTPYGDSSPGSLPQGCHQYGVPPDSQTPPEDVCYTYSLEDNNNMPTPFYGSACTSCQYDRNRYYSYNYDDVPASPARVQVTAKVLFGTVSAITNLKQKKASKKK